MDLISLYSDDGTSGTSIMVIGGSGAIPGGGYTDYMPGWEPQRSGQNSGGNGGTDHVDRDTWP